MPLSKKSIHDLRAIAQGYGIPDIFKQDAIQLRQAIELRQQEAIPRPNEPPPRPEYDARLMTKPPAKKGSEEEIQELLAPHVRRGLHLSFPEPEIWAMSFGKKSDTGSMRMPLRVILNCAEKVLSGK